MTAFCNARNAFCEYKSGRQGTPKEQAGGDSCKSDTDKQTEEDPQLDDTVGDAGGDSCSKKEDESEIGESNRYATPYKHRHGNDFPGRMAVFGQAVKLLPARPFGDEAAPKFGPKMVD